MNSNQQLSDYIFYYPEAMDSKTCNDIIKHFDIGAKWKQSLNIGIQFFYI